MTIKEKAKAYDKAIEKIKYVMEHRVSPTLNKEDLEDIFSELQESEDERIRKDIIVLVKDWWDRVDKDNISAKEQMLAWLEKQGKEEYALKSFKEEDVHKFMRYIEKEAKAYEFNLPNRGYDIYAFAKDILAWLEKQGEKKPTLRERYENIGKSEWFKRTHDGMSCGMITPEESLGISSEEYNKVVSDCIMSEPKTTHHEGWVNIYKHEDGYTLSSEMLNTVEEARKYWNKNTVATIKIYWEE